MYRHTLQETYNMKTKTFLVADGESTGLADKAYLFDFGYVIGNRKGDAIVERSFLVREILTNPRIMLGALYNDDWRAMMGGKLFSHYIPELARHNAALYNWSDIVATMREDMLTHSVDVFAAYNLRFDMGAIATTQKHINNAGKVLAYTPDLLCLWEFACTTLCNTPMYHRIAEQMGNDAGWITDAGNVRTNAEKVYAYVSGQYDFVENHTALSDARIEFEILQRLLASKKTIPYNVLDHMPWRKAQNIGLDQRKLF
jgi:hypothetical protein